MYRNGDISEEEFEEKIAELRISKEFQSTRDKLMADYEKAYNKHKERNPNRDESISRAIRKVLH